MALLMKVIESKAILETIAKGGWHIIQRTNQPDRLVTSDRPIAFARNRAGLTRLEFALSPNLLFVCEFGSIVQDLHAKPVKEVFRAYNRTVVRQAATYVYASDLCATSLVKRRFGEGPVQMIGNPTIPDVGEIIATSR